MRQIKIKSLFFLTLIVGLSGCLKEDRLNIDTDQGPKSVVEFANTGVNVAAAASTYPRFNMDLGSIAPGGEVEFNVNVSYSGADVAPEDITVALSMDADALAKFNTENGTHYEIPAADIFTLPTSVVIQKGTSMSQTKVKIVNSASYDFSKAYALPLKIVSATTGIISSNFGKVVYSFGARNSYDGMYSYDGSTTRNSAAGVDLAFSGSFTDFPARSLATLSANSVTIVPLWANKSGIGGIDGTYATVDPATNLVTMASTTNATLKNTPGEVNKYDPATKTFTLAFDWGVAPATRVVTMILTYTGPR